MVYRILTDQFEASEPGDMTWLDVVLAVHPHLDPTGRADVASVVHGFVLQEAFFDVTPAEARRIRGAFGGAPLNADLGDGPARHGGPPARHHPIADHGRGSTGRRLRCNHRQPVRPASG